MKQSVVIIIVLVTLMSSCREKTCEEQGKHSSVNYRNNSPRNLEYLTTDNYPDTIMQDKNNPQNDVGKYLLPYTTSELRFSRGKASLCVEGTFNSRDFVWVYFIDNDSINLLSWDTVSTTGRGILERREINLQYLLENDFVVTYQE